MYMAMVWPAGLFLKLWKGNSRRIEDLGNERNF